MDNLKDRFKDFGKEPSSEVWENISAAIGQDTSKKKAWYYWVAALLIIGVGLGLYTVIGRDAQPDNPLHSTNNKEQNRQDEKTISAEKTTNPSPESMPNKNHTLPSNAEEKNTLAEKSSTQKNTNPADNLYPSSTDTMADSHPDAPIDKPTKNHAIAHPNPIVVDPSLTTTSDNNNNNNNNNNNLAENDTTHPTTDLGLPTNTLAEIKPNNAENTHPGIAIDVDYASQDNHLSMHTSPQGDIDMLPAIDAESIAYDAPKNLLDTDVKHKKLNYKKWSLAMGVQQGMIQYNTIENNTYYLNTDAEISTIFEIAPTIDTTVIHHQRPQWLEIELSRHLGPKNRLILGVEAGTIRSNMSTNGIAKGNLNTHSVAVTLGFDHTLFHKNMWTFSTGGQFGGGISNTTWNETIHPETTQADNFITQETKAYSTPANTSFYQGEWNTIIAYQIRENIALQIKPFAKRYFSKTFPNSSIHNKPFQWGLGAAVQF